MLKYNCIQKGIRYMRYLGFDLGTRTLGISISDETKTIATGLTTLRFNDSDYDSILDEIKNIVKEKNIEKIVLGLPKNMNNTLGERAEHLALSAFEGGAHDEAPASAAGTQSTPGERQSNEHEDEGDGMRLAQEVETSPDELHVVFGREFGVVSDIEEGRET